MLLIRIIALSILFIYISGCSKSKPLHYQGYVEGENIYLATPNSGILEKMLVHRGQQVNKGDLLFELDTNPEAIQLHDMEGQLSEAKKLYKDLVNPKRSPEIAAIQAQIGQTEAQLTLAKLRVERYQQLLKKKVVNQDAVDEVIARYEELKALKGKYTADLALAKQGSREEQINAQQAKVNSIYAKVEEVRWQLSQKKRHAPFSGIIFDTYFDEGEFVPNQQPLLSLLTPENIHLEFFVPASDLKQFKIGQKLRFECMGCNDENIATISYISPEAEYVPPLVYSRENSNKIVFRIKAEPKDSVLYKPGQPIMIIGFAND